MKIQFPRLPGRSFRRLVLVSLFLVLLAVQTNVFAGTWTPVATKATNWVQLMLLLPDGTVMAGNNYTSGGGYGNAWYKLTPDSSGHYINGAWSNRKSANYTRLWCSSAVLQSGKVFLAGAEYGTGTATAEIYDPYYDSWTDVSPPASILDPKVGAGFVDSECKVMADGRVLVIPVNPEYYLETLIYDPAANSWSTGPSTVRTLDETGWVKLPDGSFITIDPDQNSSERFIPSLNVWTNDAVVPVSVWATLSGYVGETGPAILLPNGRAIFIGGSGHTAIYIPSGNNSNGSWVQGPDIPGGLVAADSPGAMMVNGKILLTAAPAPYVSSGNLVFPTPVSFFEYDYNNHAAGPNGTFTQIFGPANSLTDNVPSYETLMLDLPDGTVLYSHWTNQLFVYQPDPPALASAKPVIYSTAYNADGSIHLTGTQFNGISEGAAYGDDAQMDSNYPLVRFTASNGHVYYGRTYNWSSTGVQTGNQVVSTDCEIPALVFGGPGAYTMQVVANGIASDPVGFPGPVWVDFNFAGSTQLGTYFYPFSTLVQGINTVASGATILLKPGHSPSPITISTAMTLNTFGGTAYIGQ